MNNFLASGLAQTEMSQHGFTGQAAGAVGAEIGPNGEVLGAETVASADMTGHGGMISADAMALYKKL